MMPTVHEESPRTYGETVGRTRAFRTWRIPSSLQKYASTITHQPWRWLTLIFGINLALVGVVIVLDLHYRVDYWDLVRDTNAIADQPAYFGFYSNLGVLIWAIAASIALFSWASLLRSGIATRKSRALLLGGLFAAVACLDDLFMLHEHAYVIGITEEIVLAGYALCLLAFVAAIVPVAHETQWIYLAASLAFLALSTVVDILYLPIPGSLLIEEFFKFSGIALLATYLVRLSFSALVGRLLRGGNGTPSTGRPIPVGDRLRDAKPVDAPTNASRGCQVMQRP